jgi:hypothetical protein
MASAPCEAVVSGIFGAWIAARGLSSVAPGMATTDSKLQLTRVMAGLSTCIVSEGDLFGSWRAPPA